MCVEWTSPVKVATSKAERLVAGPADALECLNEWPVPGGWFYERAKNRCHAALEMGADSEVARHAFLAATIEALIACEPVKGPDNDNVVLDPTPPRVAPAKTAV